MQALQIKLVRITNGPFMVKVLVGPKDVFREEVESFLINIKHYLREDLGRLLIDH